MAINKLSDRKVQSAKCPSGIKAKFLSDGGGLYLRVSAAGGRSWIFRYESNGKVHDLGLGAVHTVSLAEARAAALECRKLRHAGKDPLQVRRAERKREVPSFETFAEGYITNQEPGWRGKRTADDWRNTLHQHIYPKLGPVALNEIDTPLVVQAIRPLWDVRPEQGRRVLRRIEKVLDAAKAAGFRAGDNPASWGILEFLLPAPAAGTDAHHPAMPYSEVPGFLHSLENQPKTSTWALRMLVLTAVRTSELIKAGWEEFDLDDRTWTIPAERMKRKGRGDFRVPLSDAALAVLREVPRAGAGPFRVGERTMYKLMESRGLMSSPHGLRSSFKDWATERTNFAEEIAEACLAHFPNDKTVAAYQRGDRLEQRRRLMEAWGRFCTSSEPAEVIPLRAPAQA